MLKIEIKNTYKIFRKDDDIFINIKDKHRGFTRKFIKQTIFKFLDRN